MARAIDIQPIIEEIQSSIEIPSYSEHDKGFDDALKYILDLIEEAPTITPPNEPRMINADKLAKRIAGHSNYHGDSILAAIYCAAEGKENDAPIRPIETPPNEPLTIEQMREMDGEPVFVIINGIEPLKIWALVEVIETAKCINLTNNIGGSSEYYSQEDLDNDSITVYRRPPEGEV